MAHTHRDGQTQDLYQSARAGYEGSRLSSEGCALRDVLSWRLWIAWHLLAQQLWHAYEPWLCESDNRRCSLVVQLGICWYRGKRALLAFEKGDSHFAPLSSASGCCTK